MRTTLNLDFDGTCVTHNFPTVGSNIGAEFVLEKLIENKHQLILFTMRCNHTEDPVSDQPDIIAKAGDYLTDAVNWFDTHNIPLYGVQTNPTQSGWTSSPKSYAHLMIDDSSLGVPLLNIPTISDREFVNWIMIAYMLEEKGLISTPQSVTCMNQICKYFDKNYEIDLKEHLQKEVYKL